jgi:excisionase family DNA binding protein
MDKHGQMEPAVLSVRQALSLVEGALSRASLYAAISRNEIPHRRVGRKVLIPRRRFLAWLEGTDSRPQPGRGGADDRG